MSLMPSPVFRWFVPAQNGTGLVPAAGYKAKFYSSGTDIAKTIYEDADLNTPYPSPSNVAVLNAEGFALIYLGPGVYKLVVTDSADSVVWTQDNIQGDGSFGTGFADSFAALADVNPLLNKYCYIGGYSAPGDGGQGMFYNKVSNVPSDGGYTLQSNVDPTYVWFRIPDESGDVRAAAFGYIPTTGTVQTAQLQAADNYATSIGARLIIEAGSDAQVGVVTFNAPYVHFEPGARLKGVASPPQPAITFNGIVTGPNEQIFAYRSGSLSVTVTFSDYQVSQNPQWFGAINTPGSEAVNDAAFAAWKAAGGGYFILPPGDWPTTLGTVLQSFTKGLTRLGTSGAYVGLGSYLPGDSHHRFDTWNLSNGYSISPYTGGAQTDGVWKVAGDVVVDQNVEVTGTLDAAGITAGVSGVYSGADIQAVGNAIIGGNIQPAVISSSYLKGLAGTGTGTFKAGGIILDGASATVLANTLVNVGDKLEVVAYGGVVDSTNGMDFSFGGHTINIGPWTNGNTAWVLTGFVKVVSSNHVDIVASVTANQGTTINGARANISANQAVTLSSNQTISVSQTGLTVTGMDVKYFPAKP